MTIRSRRLVAMAAGVAVSVSGCAFGGLNSLPLPGAVGRGPGATNYHVELANVATLEPNSPVLVGDVVVGSVNSMNVRDWHADVEISVKPDVQIPANAVATVGQTSLLGSMHLALNPPLGQAPSGRLAPGATLGLGKTSTYPSTEQTLSALSVVINGGGVGQIGDIVTELNQALNGREPQIRDLLTRLNDFVGVLATQRDAINATVVSLNRVAGTFAGQREVLTRALDRIPPALDVLVAERPNLTAALDKLGKFSAVATGVVNDTQADLVRDLEPGRGHAQSQPARRRRTPPRPTRSPDRRRAGRLRPPLHLATRLARHRQQQPGRSQPARRRDRPPARQPSRRRTARRIPQGRAGTARPRRAAQGEDLLECRRRPRP
jgi:virulence factor Mce-like protein